MDRISRRMSRASRRSSREAGSNAVVDAMEVQVVSQRREQDEDQTEVSPRNSASRSVADGEEAGRVEEIAELRIEEVEENSEDSGEEEGESSYEDDDDEAEDDYFSYVYFMQFKRCSDVEQYDREFKGVMSLYQSRLERFGSGKRKSRRSSLLSDVGRKLRGVFSSSKASGNNTSQAWQSSRTEKVDASQLDLESIFWLFNYKEATTVSASDFEEKTPKEMALQVFKNDFVALDKTATLSTVGKFLQAYSPLPNVKILKVENCNPASGLSSNSSFGAPKHTPDGIKLPFHTGFFITWMADKISLTKGKWYYEVVVNNMQNGLFQIGWSNNEESYNPNSDSGVGDTSRSWAFDGGRLLRWHNGESTTFGTHFDSHVSKVVGCALDLDNMRMLFSYNGSWDSPMGEAYSNLPSIGYSPGMTFHVGSSATVNFGQVEFKHGPPSDDYRPVIDEYLGAQTADLQRRKSRSSPKRTGLETLLISRSSFGPSVMTKLLTEAVYSLSNLHFLGLGKSLASASSVQELEKLGSCILIGCPKLIGISLSDNKLTFPCIAALSPVLLRCEVVLLDGNSLSGSEDAQLISELFSSSNHLKTLSLGKNGFGDEGSSILLRQLGCRMLRDFRLDQTGAGEICWETLMELSDGCPLETLSLRKSPRLLASIPHSISARIGLKSLNLNWSDLMRGEQDIEKVAAIMEWAPYLEKLGLVGTPLNSAQALTVIDLVGRKLPNLITLKISATKSWENADYNRVLDAVIDNTSLKLFSLDHKTNSEMKDQLWLKVFEIIVKNIEKGKPVPIFRVGVSPGLNALNIFQTAMVDSGGDCQVALYEVFKRDWKLSENDLSYFKKLHHWALKILNGIPNDDLPILRVKGDLSIQNREDVEACELPTRMHVCGNFYLKNATCPGWENMTYFTVDQKFYLVSVESERIPDCLAVGMAIILDKCKIRSLYLRHSHPSINCLPHLQLTQLDELEDFEATIEIGYLYIGDCPQVRRLPTTLSVVASFVLETCNGVTSIPPMNLSTLDVLSCAQLAEIGPGPQKMLLLNCPNLLCTPEGKCESITLKNCQQITQIKRIPSSRLVVIDCPKILALQGNRGSRASKNSSLEELTVRNCPALKEISNITVRSELNLKGFNLFEVLPIELCGAEEVVLKHCSNFRRFPDGAVIQDIYVSHCQQFETLAGLGAGKHDAHISKIHIQKCERFSEALPAIHVDEIQINSCPRITSIPPIKVTSLTLEDLPNLSAIGGMGPEDVIELSDLSLSELPQLQRVAFVKVETLNISDCPLYRGIEDSLEVTESASFFGTGLTDIPNWFVERTPYTDSDVRLTTERLMILEEIAQEHGTTIEVSDEDPDDDYDFDDEDDNKFDNLVDAVLFWEQEAQVEHDPVRLTLEVIIPAYYVEGCLQFFSKLSKTAEYQRSNLRQGLGTRVVEVIDLLLEDELSREEILTRIADSVDRCHDKPVWALNQVAIHAKICHARGDRDKLREIGHGIMRLAVVHTHAQKKLEELGSDSDDVCVYLKFEIQLKEKLDLPVSACRMLFPSYTTLTQKEIDETIEDARNISEEEFEVWLADWSEWQRQMRLEFAANLSWEILEPSKDSKRISASLTSFSGEEMTEPVMLGRSGPYNFQELMQRWVETGMDFSNVLWSAESLFSNLRSVVVPQS